MFDKYLQNIQFDFSTFFDWKVEIIKKRFQIYLLIMPINYKKKKQIEKKNRFFWLSY